MQEDDIRTKRVTKLSQPESEKQPSIQMAPMKQATQQMPSPKQSMKLSPQEYNSQILSQIFTISLQSQNSDNIYLKDLADEFKQESLPLLISSDNLDRVLVGRLSLETANESSIIYLLHCYDRLTEQRHLLSKLSVNEELYACLGKAEELICSYFVLLLQYPEMFPTGPQPITTEAQLEIASVHHVSLMQLLLSQSMNADFLSLIIQKYQQQEEEFLAVFKPLFLLLSLEANSNAEEPTRFLQILQALVFLLHFPILANMVHKFDNFFLSSQKYLFNIILSLNALYWEQNTFLGSFFRFSCFGTDFPKFSQTHFPVSSSNIESFQYMHHQYQPVIYSWRLSLENIQQQQYQILYLLVKASNESRESLIKWLWKVIDLNQERGKMQIREGKIVSTEGFLNNLAVCCLKLCEPIMDLEFQKIHLIDPEFLHKNPVTCQILAEETKLNGSGLDNEKSYYQPKELETKPNFVTEIFFLTVMLSHFGIMKSFGIYFDMIKRIQEAEEHLEMFKQRADQHNPQVKMVIARLEKLVEKMMSQKLSFDIQLLQKTFLATILRFHHLTMRFLLRVCTSPSAKVPLNDPQYAKGIHFRLIFNNQELKITTAPPECFRMYPEWLIENLMEFLLDLFRVQPNFILESPGYLDELMGFILIFLKTRQNHNQQSNEEDESQIVLVKNPYLIAKMVEVLFVMTLDMDHYQQIGTAVRGLFATHPLLRKYLAPALISFYVDVEKTGQSGQFYSKFNIRYQLAKILKLLWHDYPADLYRHTIQQQSVTQWELFVKFVNLLMNDTTYLLDEGLGKLQELRSLQIEMDDVSFSQQNPQQQEEKKKKLADLERNIKSLIQLANETVAMLQYMTSAIQDPFLRPEIIDRLAAMLNFNLVQLVGPKCQELKVKNPEKFHFRPRDLLSALVDVYLNLKGQNNTDSPFIQAIAKDGRSFNKKYFDKACQILANRQVKDLALIQQFQQFAENCQKYLEIEQQQEEDLGEVPDEFLDPLMYTLMEDPVILPTSKVTVDRSTIKSHLLSDNTDPFNRMPLSLEMVQPDLEMKEKIQQWKQNRMKK